ncbi:MAG: histidine kinase [Planctomycetaceae bacterium]|mgnify:CR=1 FL=1|nr:histidine kinase [Planctomycetaceae bacterium]
MVRQAIGALLLFSIAGSILALPARAAETNVSRSESIIHRISSANERQQMVVNTSRILTLERPIPQAQVNNPEILDLTPLSPTEIQLAAKKAGVTQVNLWDENKSIFTVDVVVYGDTRELEMLLSEQFPNASLKIRGYADSVLISGFVDHAHDVNSIVRIAETFYPNKVVTRLQVGGVQQVLLHVKVMEVSRTKFRDMGFDWSYISGTNVITSAAAGLIASATAATGTDPAAVELNSGNFMFNVINGPTTFFGVLEAMRGDNMAKLLSEPTLVTVSGRPASFQCGGEVPVVSGGGLGVPSNTVYKPYGTQVDFVPIVLGNGRIRLEIRPEVSEIDGARKGPNGEPAFRNRKVDTGVELEAGQTLAIAGLLQHRIETSRQGLPWVSELPYVGAAFRRDQEKMNEVELLIFVTPELVAGMDADQVPQCGPGMGTTSPSDWELYLKGYIEVPNCCPPCNGQGCEACDQAIDGGAGLPQMIDSGEGRTIEMNEIPSPQPRQLPVPESIPPSVPLPQRNAAPPQTPAAPASVRYQNARPITPTATPAPKALPVSTGGSTTSPLPTLIGPIGYDVAG